MMTDQAKMDSMMDGMGKMMKDMASMMKVCQGMMKDMESMMGKMEDMKKGAMKDEYSDAYEQANREEHKPIMPMKKKMGGM